MMLKFLFNHQIGAGEPMRIAFYSPALPDSGESNGIVTYVRIMRDALRDLGHWVMVVTPDHAELFGHGIVELPESRFARIRSRSLRRDGSHPWARMRVVDAFRYAKLRGAQVFEIEESFGWSSLLRGIPVVTRVHGPHGFTGSTDQIRDEAEVDALSRARFVTAPTQSVLNAMRERYGLQLVNSKAILNPMYEAYERWEGGSDQILFVGRNDEQKGADIVLRAFAKAREALPSLNLIVVGPGFEGGARSPDELMKLRVQSSLCVIGSRAETFSYALAEAMAVGMPIVTTNCFGPAELIRDGIDGRLVPIDDPDAMAAAIVETLSDRERMEEMGRSARMRLCSMCSPGRIAEETAALYRSLLTPSVGHRWLSSTPLRLSEPSR
jgi:glycosyltransferase involved in cell wall biosynthesis